MKISVIVPHYEQYEDLRKCISSLLAQTYCGDYEIIIVDNNSQHSLDDVKADFPMITFLKETAPGPGYARNHGVQNAVGDVLAFIDADCVADSNWLEAISSYFIRKYEQPLGQMVDIIGGDVRTAYRIADKPDFIEPYEAIYSYRNHLHIAEGYSGTGNMATTRAVFDDIGPFCGMEKAEDRDWGERARYKGYKIEYRSDMIIYHPARLSLSELFDKWKRHIYHDRNELSPTLKAHISWLLKAIALPFTPLIEIKTIMCSKRVKGAKERMMAFICLFLVRGYRSVQMLRLLITSPKGTKSDWSR